MKAQRTHSLSLDRALDEVVDWRFKSWPAASGVTVRTVRDQGWNVLGGEFLLPVMVLKDAALRHNIAEMASLCERQGWSLAPHGKTWMSPQLLQRQLDAGTWAVTAATTWQVRVWRAFGMDRVILANELVEPASIAWLADEMRRDPDFDFYCLVDSYAGVRLLDDALHAARANRRMNVLLELGFAGGRTGCRNRDEAFAVARVVSSSKHLALAGVEAFEGIVHAGSLRADLDAAGELIGRVRAMAEELDRTGMFERASEVLVTAGGSAFLDRVIAGLGDRWDLSRPVRKVLRSGCYLTHDAIHYREASPFGSRLADTSPLEEALEVWGAVLSTPEPGLALLGFGKRDVPHDMGLPVPRFVKRPGQPVRKFKTGATIAGLNDQHAYLRLEDAEDLRPGDMVGCGVSHPCTAFDKWRLLPVVDGDYRVVEAVMTYF